MDHKIYKTFRILINSLKFSCEIISFILIIEQNYMKINIRKTSNPRSRNKNPCSAFSYSATLILFNFSLKKKELQN